MEIKNRITRLFDIKYPIIQAGMVWVSGWKLASAVSNCGGLGLIGAGSMKPDLLREHIQKCRSATKKPFGVNIPLLRGDAHKLIETTVDENVNVVFTSAGHPGKFLDQLKSNQITVVHVVSSLKFARKAEEAGCDAVVGEGVEAGGHNGLDEITTLCLIPILVDELRIPVIAAGGITDGRGILSVFSLGAEGVQMGTRFAATVESSGHKLYTQRIVEAADNGTTLVLKKIAMARMLKNEFSREALETEFSGADNRKLKALLGEKREFRGIFEGDVDHGLIEAGQGSAQINDIPKVSELLGRLILEYDTALNRIKRNFQPDSDAHLPNSSNE